MPYAMIVAPQPEAVEEGALILKNGGNAVDAAIGGALVQTLVDPQMCGLAGFGTMQLYLPALNHHGFIEKIKGSCLHSCHSVKNEDTTPFVFSKSIPWEKS